MSVFPHELQWLPPRGMAKAVLGWFLSHPQLQVSDQNRLASQCRLIVRSEGVIQKDHRDWRTFVQSLKDVQEYWFIIQALGDRLLQSTFSARLARSLDDSTLPVDSGASTPGRDAQFELLVAAVAARAGLVVDRLSGAGADWIITAQARCWSFEAKRIKNFNMIERRIRKGARQIAASQIGGVIALDISLATNPTCEPLPMFIPDRDIEEAHGERTRALVSEKLGAVEQ